MHDKTYIFFKHHLIVSVNYGIGKYIKIYVACDNIAMVRRLKLILFLILEIIFNLRTKEAINLLFRENVNGCKYPCKIISLNIILTEV